MPCFVATCLAAAFSTLVMGLYANYPIALAPGMGLNAFFSYTVVLGLGYDWETALGSVFVAGLLFVALSVLPVRRWIIDAVPQGRRLAISAGIGLFLGVIALQNADIIQASPATLVTTGELMAPGPVLTLLGFSAIVALSARSVPGAALIGILGVTATGITVGVSDWQGLASLPPDPASTLLALDVSGALQVGMIPVILTFLIVDLFDTAGTLIGVAQQAKLLDARGRMSGMQRALIADSTGTVAGALFGTSPVTSYVESAAGTSAGGRMGLTAVVAAGLFLLCLFFAPLAPKPHRPWIAPVTPTPQRRLLSRVLLPRQRLHFLVEQLFYLHQSQWNQRPDHLHLRVHIQSRVLLPTHDLDLTQHTRLLAFLDRT